MARATGMHREHEQGMLLLEALVAMTIVAMVTLSFLGMRTTALIDATRARNWRLAREIAEEKLSILQAGAHEVAPQSGTKVPIDKYQGFSFKIVLGEANVADAESEIATDAAGDDSATQDRIEWQNNRRDRDRAGELGLSASEYEDTKFDDINERLAAKAPSADEFEEVAVVVYFPKTEPDYPGQEEALLIRTRVSTLAISGLTPDQAESLRSAKEGNSGDSRPIVPSGTTGTSGGLPAGGGR